MFIRIYLSFIIFFLSYTNYEAFSNENQQLHIYSSTNLMGYVRPCGWGSKRLGGLARRASYIKDKSEEDENVLILDCGDFIGGRNEGYKVKANYLLKGLMKLECDVINLGEKDFLLGGKFLLEMKEKYNLPFISSNIFYDDSTTRFTEPYKIIEFKKRKLGFFSKTLKIGIFGVMLKRSKLIYINDDLNLVTKDPIKIATEMVKQLESEKCDIIIALAHLSSFQINDFASNVKGIDIIVGGHDYAKRAAPYNVDDAVIIQSGSKGQYIGDLHVVLNDDNKIISTNGTIPDLSKDINDDPDYTDLVKEFEKEYSEVMQKMYKSRRPISKGNK